MGSIISPDFKYNMCTAIAKCLHEHEIIKNMTKISRSITQGMGAEICAEKLFSLTMTEGRKKKGMTLFW